MTVRGLGTDIVSVERIAALAGRHQKRFLDRVFRPQEQEVLQRVGRAAMAGLAARWAAKEAFVKALGPGAPACPTGTWRWCAVRPAAPACACTARRRGP
jgi:phosphopantetheine--protein transferase-like protein